MTVEKIAMIFQMGSRSDGTLGPVLHTEHSGAGAAALAPASGGPVAAQPSSLPPSGESPDECTGLTPSDDPCSLRLWKHCL
ncbi:unnamed protein product [Gadus morhua 'NCC']